MLPSMELFDNDGENIFDSSTLLFDATGRLALTAAGVTVGDFMPSKRGGGVADMMTRYRSFFLQGTISHQLYRVQQ